MPRNLPIGNGSLLVAFDSQYRLADFYFPRVGMENHAAGKFCFGVWTDGALHATDEAPWHRTLEYLRDTLVTDVQLQHETIGLRIRCYDTVDPDSNIYLRKIVVRNLRNEARDIKLFLHQDFGLYGNRIGDTVLFSPELRAIVQYKARRYVLINCDAGVSEYACGRSGTDGTWSDAQDGALSMTAIAQGAGDS